MLHIYPIPLLKHLLYSYVRISAKPNVTAQPMKTQKTDVKVEEHVNKVFNTIGSLLTLPRDVFKVKTGFKLTKRLKPNQN